MKLLVGTIKSRIKVF